MADKFILKSNRNVIAIGSIFYDHDLPSTK